MGKGSRRPAGGRPPGRIGRGGIGPAAGNPVPPVSYKGKGAKGGCEMAIPVAVVMTLFYAMPRMLVDHLRRRRG